MRIDGIGNARNLLSLEQSTRLCLRLQPSATGHIIDISICEYLLLLPPDGRRQIIVSPATRQIFAISTAVDKITATECEVTDSRSRPDIVHGPHHGFPASQDLLDAVQREHALIDPMQMDDVGLLKLPQFGNVGTAIGDVNFEKMLAREVQLTEDDESLPEEMPMEHR